LWFTNTNTKCNFGRDFVLVAGKSYSTWQRNDDLEKNFNFVNVHVSHGIGSGIETIVYPSIQEDLFQHNRHEEKKLEDNLFGPHLLKRILEDDFGMSKSDFDARAAEILKTEDPTCNSVDASGIYNSLLSTVCHYQRCLSDKTKVPIILPSRRMDMCFVQEQIVIVT
jgi:hypothetical protein